MPSLIVNDVVGGDGQQQQASSSLESLSCNDNDNCKKEPMIVEDRSKPEKESTSNNDSSNLIQGTSIKSSDMEKESDDATPGSKDKGIDLSIEVTTTTPTSNKRKVTPREDTDSKEKQQKNVNQMSLSSFFFAAGGNKTYSKTTTSDDTNSSISNAKNKKKQKVEDTTTDSCPTNNAAGKAKQNRSKKTSTDSLLIHTKSPGPASAEKPKSKEKKDSGQNNTSKEVLQQRLPEEVQNAALESSATSPGTLETKATNVEVLQYDDIDDSESSKETKSGSRAAAQQDVSISPKASTATSKTKSTTSAGKPKSNSAKKRKASASSPIATNNSGTPSNTTSEDETSQETMMISSPKQLFKEGDLPEERRSLYQKYQTMKSRYLKRATILIAQTKTDGIEAEKYDVIKLEPSEEEIETLDLENDEYPTHVVTNMALMIEGSGLPLSELTNTIRSELKSLYEKEWTTESVSAKIKLLAQRKPCFDTPSKPSTIVDLFEDEDNDRLWRWEFSTLDLLPSEMVSKAKKARTARKKLASHHTAILKLIKSFYDIESLIADPKLPELDDAIAKISRDEEKVLKFEREAEKQRLADEAKVKKQQELEVKKRAKEEAAEKKRREKEEAAEQKRREKEEAAQAREEAKRRKEEEKEQMEEEKKIQEEQKQKTLVKQKNCFLSFFNSAPKKKKVSFEPEKPVTVASIVAKEHFDAKSFRSQIGSSGRACSVRFPKLSRTATASRKRRTKEVAVMVYTTGETEQSDWDAPAYAEQKTIFVPNRYKFLSFHEDCRPPYHGTWSKKSSIVTGRTPFGKETSVFDYDYDSEAEWEEGDDEIGEDVDDDAKNQEEDAEDEAAALYDFNDGFCVADEQFLDLEEDADEETRALYKKKLQCGEHEQQMNTHRIRILAPGFGGMPLNLMNSSKNAVEDCVEGFDTENIQDVFMSYQGVTFNDSKLYLDAFPQLSMDEDDPSEQPPDATVSRDKDEYDTEAMVALASFAHHCTLNSKDKLIEELRNSHPNLFENRAKATRKLDAIADKNKHPNTTGYYWEVKKEVLQELSLTDLIDKPLEGISSMEDGTTPAGNNIAATKDQTKKKSTKKKRKPSQDMSEHYSPSKKKGTKKKRKPSQDMSEHDSPSKKRKPDQETTKGSGETKGNSPKSVASDGMKNIMAQFLKKPSPKSNDKESN